MEIRNTTTLFCWTIFTLIGCQSKFSRVEIIESWEDNSPKTELVYSSADTTEFELKEYYQNGQLMSKSNIKDFRRNGTSMFYYTNGQLKYKIEYLEDLQHGPSSFWYQNGQQWQTSNYKNGMFHGKVVDYYENGKTKSEGTFDNGLGNITYYHPNGKTWKYGELKNGLENGLWKHYDSLGNISSEGNYINGNRNGDYRRYYENGNIWEKGVYEENVIVDISIFTRDGNFDQAMTDFSKKYSNTIPWTEEQRNFEIKKCINRNLERQNKRSDDYCYCRIDKVELFLTYQEYLSLPESEVTTLLRLVNNDCDYQL